MRHPTRDFCTLFRKTLSYILAFAACLAALRVIGEPDPTFTTWQALIWTLQGLAALAVLAPLAYLTYPKKGHDK